MSGNQSLQAISHTDEQCTSVVVGAHDGAVGLLSLIFEVALVHRLDVSLALSVGQVVGFEEQAQSACKPFLGAEVQSERAFIPLVGVLEGRHDDQSRAGVGGGELCVPSVCGATVEQRQVGGVRSLVYEWSRLCHSVLILCAAGLVLSLGGGDGRVCVGVVSLQSEVAYELQHVHFKAHILGVAEVLWLIKRVGAADKLRV